LSYGAAEAVALAQDAVNHLLKQQQAEHTVFEQYKQLQVVSIQFVQEDLAVDPIIV
jgi:hypothetical protein